jgi:methylenetetrahydrofolate reductase (NADPH)
MAADAALDGFSQVVTAEAENIQESNMNLEISIEFFPPQTDEGMEKLRTTVTRLAALKPEFFSVTYGAGGSTRDRTLATVMEIAAQGHPAAPHLSCIGSTRGGVREMLATFTERGIGRIVALRGDLPSGMADAGEFRYANELVKFIRDETGNRFHIEVAAYPEWHPQAKSPRDDLLNFKRKVDAGASSAITQYFYNADAYEHFVEQARALGVTVPIIPGIMPIASFSKLARFSDACGAEIPRWMRRKFESFGDDAESIRSFGLDVVTELCQRLIERGAPGLHFYSMNQAGLTLEVCRRLGR